jgi:flagellar FliJ protein
MRRFRFPLERLLERRERIEEERRAAFAEAQDAVRRLLGEIMKTRAARDVSRERLEVVDAPDAARDRRGLVLYADFLEARLHALHDEVAARRRDEAAARAALLAATRDRKILARLRERRRLEHRRAAKRADQAATDEMARRSGPRLPEPIGTPFPGRQELPGEDPPEAS